MRTLLASALALAIAVPAAVTPAAACGPDDTVQPAAAPAVHHTASGGVSSGLLYRNDAGRYEVFISYPSVDGERGGLYGIFAELEEDGATRAFARASRDKHKRIIGLDVERTGDTGPWHVVSYRVAAFE